MPRLVVAAAMLAAAGGALLVMLERASEPRPSHRAPIVVDVPGPAIDDRLTGSKASLLGSVSPWRTDLGRRTAPAEEFLPAIPRDAIVALDEPRAEPVASVRGLHGEEPVIAVWVGAAARAYPVRVLVWHEIVNDRLGRWPIAVTYCPLCNSAVAFDRRVRGRTLTFGTTGNLRRANLVMYDRQTESWWQQITGDAIVGELTGARLRPLHAQTLAFADFAARYPSGTVLPFDTGFDRPYRTNPYTGYERPDSRPSLFRGRLDLRLRPKERVVALYGRRELVAVPVAALRRRGVLMVSLDGRRVALLYRPGVRSALQAHDPRRADDVGAVGAFAAVTRGRTLVLRPGRGGVADERTRSRFDITDRAVSGPLEGVQLAPVRHDVEFWFAVAAFAPNLRLVEP